MRRLLVLLSLVTGCTSLFGLDAPVRSDAPVADDSRDPDSKTTKDAPPMDAFTCPSGFSSPGFGGGSSKYLVMLQQTKTWSAAEADCEQRGPGIHLVVYSNDAERELGKQAVNADAWLGFTDLVNENNFRWVTDEDNGGYPPPTSPPWAAGAPTNDSPTESCVLLLDDGTLDDADCSLSRAYVCECDGYAADPSNY